MGISDWSSDVCSSDLGRVVNWTHRSVNRRIPVPFRVGFGVDKELVKQAALEAAARVPFTLATEGEQRPQVWLVAYGENGVDFLLLFWLPGPAPGRNVAIQAAYLWELDPSLRDNGFEIARPQRALPRRPPSGPNAEQTHPLLPPASAPAPPPPPPGPA